MARRQGRGPKHPLLSAEDRTILFSLSETKYLRPMDVGGTDGSHHSGTLARLAEYGLVERKRWAGHVRRSYRYRRLPVLGRLIEYANSYAHIGCAGVDQAPDDPALCGKCGPCEAGQWLRMVGLNGED